MAGQDATLTVAQAKAQQERICAHGSSKKSSSPTSTSVETVSKKSY